MLAQKELANFIGRYEDLNLTHYTDMNTKDLIFNSPDNKHLVEGMVSTGAALRNPYIDLYHWVKGEIYDLEAIRNSIAVRAAVIENTKKLEAKK